MEKSSIVVRVSLVFLAAGLIGCEGGDRGTAHLEQAKLDISAEKYPAAIIQLKNALSVDSAAAEARFLLGFALFKSGNFADAEVELKKAFDLGFDKNRSTPLLAQSMLELGRYDVVVQLFEGLTLDEVVANARLKTALAIAYARSGDRKKAMETLDTVLKILPNDIPAVLFRARILAGEKEFAEAIRIADGVLARDAASVDAFALRADVRMFGLMDLVGAVADYNQVLRLAPSNINAHSALIAIHLHNRDLNTAKGQLAVMRVPFPTAIQTKTFEAQIEFLQGDYSKARDNISNLLRFAPDNVLLLQLAGATELKLNSINRAESYLNKVLSIDGSQSTARRLLGQIYIRKGQAEKALTILKPLTIGGTPDVEAMTLTAEAYLTLGDTVRSEAFFEQALRLRPNDVGVRTALALAQLSRGETAAAFNVLQTISSTDSGTLADLSIVSARIRRAEFNKALEAIDVLARKQPDKAFADNLRGRVFLRMNDIKSAQASFERALSKDQAYFPAVNSLVAIDVRAGNVSSADARLRSFLEKNPRSVPARLNLIESNIRANGPKLEIEKSLDEVIRIDPSDPLPRLAQIAYKRYLRDSKGALAAAQEALNIAPENAEIQDAMGLAQMAAGEANQAIATYSKMSVAHPRNLMPHMRTADIYVSQRNTDGARTALKRALDIDPLFVDAQFGLITLALRAKDYGEARRIARSVQQQQPKSSLGFMFEGDIEAGAGKTDAAIVAYKKGLAVPNPGGLPLKIHGLLIKSGRGTDAERFSLDWMKSHPFDVTFLMHIGNAAMLKGRNVDAEQAYRKVLAVDAKNMFALNNLAWLLLQSGKPEAVKFAASAVELAPENAAILDTYAATLAAANRLPEAVDAGRRAVKAVGSTPLYKVNLASLYLKAGNKADARAVLATIKSGSDAGVPQAEIDRLLTLAAQ